MLLLLETPSSGSFYCTTARLGTRRQNPTDSVSGDQAAGIALGIVLAKLSNTLTPSQRSPALACWTAWVPRPGREGAQFAPSTCRPRGTAMSGTCPFKPSWGQSSRDPGDQPRRLCESSGETVRTSLAPVPAACPRGARRLQPLRALKPLTTAPPGQPWTEHLCPHPCEALAVQTGLLTVTGTVTGTGTAMGQSRN